MKASMRGRRKDWMKLTRRARNYRMVKIDNRWGLKERNKRIYTEK